MSGIRGDFQELRRLRSRFAKLATPAARLDVTRAVAEAAEKQIDDSFRASRGPYGRAWAPLKSRTGRPLMDTGAHLRNTLAPKITARGFVITTAFPGAPVHQYGATIRAKNGKALVFRAGGVRPRGHGRGRTGSVVFARKVVIPRRQFMPEGTIGPIWGKAIDAAADEAIRTLAGNH